jgi:nucleoside-diphosphate-sugar epimerase
MIAFVTGGTGFVGGHLCERLRSAGWEVRALVRSARRAMLLESCGCSLIAGDLFDRPALEKGARGADVIFHLAGLTKTPQPQEFFKVNGEGTAQVVLAALAVEFTGRLLHISSQAAVGPAIAGRPRNETDPPQPVSDYGRSKFLGEERARTLGASLRPTILRPGAIYGPREQDIFEQMRAIKRTGLALVPGRLFDIQLTHVDDVVEAILLAAQNEGTANREYMLTNSAVHSNQAVTNAIADGLGQKVRTIVLPSALGWAVATGNDVVSRMRGRSVSALTRDKMRELTHAPWLADSSRLSRDTGWKPRWELRTGMASTIEWYRKHGWL